MALPSTSVELNKVFLLSVRCEELKDMKNNQFYYLILLLTYLLKAREFDIFSFPTTMMMITDILHKS